MYACSSQADDKLVNILKERGFDRICRVNLYETLPNKWTSSMKTIANNHVDIATFASPTAIKGWLLNDGRLDIPISVIGRTTYEYAKQNGFKHILCELDEKQENVFTNVREENVDSKSIIQKWAKSMVKYVENNQ